MIEFVAWPKTSRLFRGIVITEKIDGTNACVIIEEDEIAAQSRNRLITPEQDNAGFARWVYENADELKRTLGPGRHYGEWWGNGIQRKYGLLNGDKRFSLFNTSKWKDADFSSIPGLGTVPVLYEGMFSEEIIRWTLDLLVTTGSIASPGFMNVEGICIFHTQLNKVFKFTVDDEHKT